MSESESEFRYVVPECLPFEREILVLLIEECAEVQQIAAKALRFGLLSCRPGTGDTNVQLLSNEVGDLLEVMSLAEAEGLLNPEDVDAGRAHKKLQFKKYLRHRPPEGP